jgi:hypothetical protein
MRRNDPILDVISLRDDSAGVTWLAVRPPDIEGDTGSLVLDFYILHAAASHLYRRRDPANQDRSERFRNLTSRHLYLFFGSLCLLLPSFDLQARSLCKFFGSASLPSYGSPRTEEHNDGHRLKRDFNHILQLYFPAFFTFAHRAFCAATILARPAALIFRPLGLGDSFAAGLPVGLPPNRAFASWSRRISASIASMI